MINIEPHSGTSIPLQLRSILIEEISRGVYSSSGKLPAERALAERFGVSRTSVRECLNVLVKDGVLVRLVGKGTFFASACTNPGVPPVKESVGHLAFLIGENIFQFVQPGYTRILVGAEQACRKQGYRLLFHSVGEEEDDPQLGLPQGQPDGVRGVLVAGGLRKKTLERIVKWKVPIVLTDLIVDDDNASAVGPDYASGTRQALEYLAALGHTKVGFIGFPNSEKYQTYWQTLEKLDLGYNAHFVHFLQLPDLAPGIVAGYQAIQAMLVSGPRPTAVLATNDLVAMGAIEALHLAGVRVPEEISVIGYDDLNQELRLPLTTIRSHPEEVGRIAAQMLVDNLAGNAGQNRIAVPTELVVRGTTAPPRETGASE